jgi:hypothetical protein
MTPLGQKRSKLPWLPAAKSTTEQKVKLAAISLAFRSVRNLMAHPDYKRTDLATDPRASAAPAAA